MILVSFLLFLTFHLSSSPPIHTPLTAVLSFMEGDPLSMSRKGQHHHHYSRRVVARSLILLLSTTLLLQTMAVTPAPIGVVPAPDNLASPLINDQQKQQQAIMAAQDAPDYNPQQQPTPNAQLIDQDTYNGRTPQATYRTYDPAIETLPSSAALSKDYDPPGPTTQVDADIQKLAESLTLKELAGQMTQIQIGMLLDKSGELDMGKTEYWIREWGVGSFLDTPTK